MRAREGVLCLFLLGLGVAGMQMDTTRLRNGHNASAELTSAAKLYQRSLEGVSRKGLAHRIPASGPAAVGALHDLQWLHFPKTGTSFVATIWGYACGQGAVPIDLAVDSNAAHGCGQCFDKALMERYPERDYCEPGVLSDFFDPQHQPVTFDEVQSDMVVGLFRRPSQRLISAYNDNLHASGFSPTTYQLLKEACYGETVAAYARFDGVAGCTARMLTGGHCTEDPSVRRGKEFDGGLSRVKEAVAAVQEMAFVGLTEEWDESVCLFHRMFGGGVYEDEFKNFHQGTSSAAAGHDYNEMYLDGFRDEADEVIYAAAKARFEELSRQYGGGENGTSVCATLLGLAAKQKAEASDAGAERCAAVGQECGLVGEKIDCGVCPQGRLSFAGTSGFPPLGPATCSGSGKCLLDGVPAPKLFKWHLTE